MNKQISIILLILGLGISFSIGTVFGMNHIDYEDPNWECKKTIGMWELAKQDYPGFINDTKWLADKKCGFNVDLLR